MVRLIEWYMFYYSTWGVAAETLTLGDDSLSNGCIEYLALAVLLMGHSLTLLHEPLIQMPCLNMRLAASKSVLPFLWRVRPVPVVLRITLSLLAYCGLMCLAAGQAVYTVTTLAGGNGGIQAGYSNAQGTLAMFSLPGMVAFNSTLSFALVVSLS